MKTELYDGTKHESVYETEADLKAAFEKAIADPRIKKITIKRLVPGRKRRVAKKLPEVKE